MKVQKQIGRPSITGLSLKQLGCAEYNRLRRLLRHGRKENARHWTGLSQKNLGAAEYKRRYYKLTHTATSRRYTGLSDKYLGHSEYMR